MIRIAVLTLPLLAFATGAQCSPESLAVHYAIGDFAGERNTPVALLVQAEIGGQQCSVQVDTGANAAVILHTDQSGEALEPVDFRLGSLRHTVAISQATRAAIQSCHLGDPIATVGNGFFDTGTLEIDFAAQRLTFSPEPLLANETRASSFRYAKWGAEGGHVLVPADSRKNLPNEALLDTGSLRLDLGVHDERVWRALTKRPRKHDREFSVQAWGRQHWCTTRPSRRAIILSGSKPFRPSVTYCPTLTFRPVEPILGTVGMSRYMNGRITIDYISRRWLPELPTAQ
ncbi:hypothetical protein ACH5Y9_00400 [Methylomonas sp. BW4-1]|uniref:hypothetical protein n=1 Tax=Methylomonas sp. BW4-1 TaxID=3376685 RepID=UPI004042AFC5